LRDGNLKLIVDGGSNKSEVYYLRNDPKEKRNLATELPQFIREGEQRLASWVQYQNEFYKKLFQERRKDREVAATGSAIPTR